MKISREARRTARELFRLSLVNGHVNASRAEEISTALVTERPRSYLEILKEFTRLVRLELSKRHAVIESPVQLVPSSVQEITGNLQKKFGGDITTEFLINPALLGGLRIKLGSDVWDGSISSRLSTLSKQI
jgi:F-type H+-transporting ATPase subunit delta